MMNYYGWGMRTPLFGFGFFIEIIFWVMLALLIAKLVGLLFARKNDKTVGSDETESNEESEDRALDILKKRYAKGEITKKEFESVKKDIS